MLHRTSRDCGSGQVRVQVRPVPYTVCSSRQGVSMKHIYLSSFVPRCKKMSACAIFKLYLRVDWSLGVGWAPSTEQSNALLLRRVTTHKRRKRRERAVALVAVASAHHSGSYSRGE